jgi:hypothetical protein
MLSVVLFAVRLPQYHMICETVPGPCPRFISPAKTEREIGLPRGKDFVKRSVEKLFSVKPVVIVAEGRDSVFLRKLGLLLSGLW